MPWPLPCAAVGPTSPPGKSAASWAALRPQLSVTIPKGEPAAWGGKVARTAAAGEATAAPPRAAWARPLPPQPTRARHHQGAK